MSTPFKVKAIYEYKSEYEDDLKFNAGDVITVTQVEDDQWYSGECGEERGMFPKNFVEAIGPGSEGPESESKGPESESKGPESESKGPESESKVPEPESKIPDPESKVPEPESKGPDPTPKPPSGAVFPNQKISDPYAVKKLFIAPGKSSYVPQVKPRDNSNIIGHVRQDVAQSGEIARETPRDEEPEEQPEEKLSLKERIALLQKQQQEQADRDAAAVKRQELRKQKVAEEKERMKKQREQREKEEKEKESQDNQENDPKLQPQLTEQTIESSEEETFHNAKAEESEPQPQPQLEQEQEQEQENDNDNDDNEEEPNEDEDMKRRKLVERMAKISGGRNMFGMMGMPFGAPAKEEKKETVEEDVKEDDNEEKDNEEKDHDDNKEINEKSHPQAVPIMPFADPNSLPSKLQRGSTHESMKESSSMGEDDTFTESDSKPKVNPAPPDSVKAAIQSDSGDNQSVDEKLSLNRPSLDHEPTGYEADEDLSDKPKIGSLDESTPIMQDEPSVPPIPVGDEKEEKEEKEKETESEETESQDSDDGEGAVSSQVPPIPSSQAPPIPSRDVPPIPSSQAPPIPSSQAPPTPSKDIPSVPKDAPPTPSRDVPPIPSTEAPPIPQAPRDVPPIPESVDSDDFDFESSHPSIPAAAPPVPAPAPASGPSTSPTALSTSNTGASYGSLRRASTDFSIRSKKDQVQAEQVLESMEYELANISSHSNWWLKDELPEFLAPKIGRELIYEVDSNTITKRGNRVKTYKDYYVLFYDLSQLVMELQYENEDPRSTIEVTNYFVKPVPIIRKDLLDKYYKDYGHEIISVCGGITSTKDPIVNVVFDKLDKKVLPPVGTKSYGVTIYKNINNHNIAKIDEIKPGDILCIKNGKFHVSKGLGTKTVTVGEDEIYSSIIYEYDSKKEKFKVFETENNHVKKEAYKLSDMKSGQIRIFRIVGRNYVEW